MYHKRMAKPTGVKTMPVQVRMDEELRGEIREAAAKLHWQDQDVIRMAVKIGLAKLKRINYDLASAALDAADGERARDLALAAETPPKYPARA